MKRFLFLPIFIFASLIQTTLGFSQQEEPELTRFLQTWLSAQNRADQKLYASFYDEQFQGSVQTSKGTRVFDKKNWLLFQSPLMKHGNHFGMIILNQETLPESTKNSSFYEVEVKQVLRTDAALEYIEKKLTVNRKQGVWKIIKEASEISQDPISLFPNTQKSYMPVLHPFGYPLISLYGDASWGIGPIRVENKTDKTLVAFTQKVDDKKLPKVASSWLGQQVHLFDEKTLLCKSKIIGFRLFVQRFKPEPNYVYNKEQAQSYFVQDEDSFYHNMVSSERGLDSILLVAELEPNSKCKEATWAQSVKLKVPQLIRAKPVLEETKKQILLKIHELPNYKSIQKSFQKKQANEFAADWENEGMAEFLSFQSTQPNISYVSVFLQTGSPCGDNFFGQHWTFWQVIKKQGKVEYKLHTESNTLLDASPHSLVDVNGDGVFELLMPGKILYQVQGHFEKAEETPTPYICPC